MKLKHLKPFDLTEEEKDFWNIYDSFFIEYKESIDKFLSQLDGEIEGINTINNETKIRFLNNKFFWDNSRNYFFTLDNNILVSLSYDNLKKNKYITLIFGETENKNKCLYLKLDYINKMVFLDFTKNHMFHKSQPHYLTEGIKTKLSKEINSAINTDYFFSSEFIQKMQVIKTFLVQNKLKNNSKIFEESTSDDFFDFNNFSDFIEVFNLKHDTNYQTKNSKILKKVL